MNKGLLLGSSVAIVVIVAAVLMMRMPAASNAGPERSASGADTSIASAADEQSREHYRSLSAKDLSASERATLLLAHLNRRYEGQLASLSSYWIQRGKPASSMSVTERARADVLSLVGENAWSEPAFASLFQPFRSEYPALDPKKQVAVQRLIQQYFQAHEIKQPDSAALRSAMDRSYQQLHQGIRAALTPAERSEYLVRLSPLADAVRRAHLDVKEQQFRELLALIESSEDFTKLVLRIEARRTSVSLYDPKLTELLGKEQHLSFISRFDPVYVALASLARSKSVPQEKLQALYETFVQQQGSAKGSSESIEALASSTFGPGVELIIRQLLNPAAHA